MLSKPISCCENQASCSSSGYWPESGRSVPSTICAVRASMRSKRAGGVFHACRPLRSCCWNVRLSLLASWSFFITLLHFSEIAGSSCWQVRRTGQWMMRKLLLDFVYCWSFLLLTVCSSWKVSHHQGLCVITKRGIWQPRDFENHPGIWKKKSLGSFGQQNFLGLKYYEQLFLTAVDLITISVRFY